MFFHDEYAIPSPQDYEFMGIPHEQRDILDIQELSAYVPKVAEKREELLRAGDTSVFAVNGLMRTLTSLDRQTSADQPVVQFMTRWQQMGEEPPLPPA
jgi:hypothetical protein